MDKLIEELRGEAGRSGTTAVLELMRNFDPYSIETGLEHPLPIAFRDGGWEVLDSLLIASRKV